MQLSPFDLLPLRHHRVAFYFGLLRDMPGQVTRGHSYTHGIGGGLCRVVLPPQRAALTGIAFLQECAAFIRRVNAFEI